MSSTAEQWSWIVLMITALYYLMLIGLDYIDNNRLPKCNFYCDEDDPFYCQNCGCSYEDTEKTCPYH